MQYTYSSYRHLMVQLKENGYTPIRFCDVSEDIKFPAIIRHDVDVDLQNALDMAVLENSMGIKSTYFVLLTSEYYNLLSENNMQRVRNILRLGHEIGLHFDITAYEKETSQKKLGGLIQKECAILEEALDIRIRSISWHIPVKNLLGVHLDFMDELELVNAYDPYFYNDYKYVSDSMMRWREPIEEYIEDKKFEKFQILTHPIWYRDTQDKTDKEILDLNREKKAKEQNCYLNTIRPGYYL